MAIVLNAAFFTVLASIALGMLLLGQHSAPAAKESKHWSTARLVAAILLFVYAGLVAIQTVSASAS